MMKIIVLTLSFFSTLLMASLGYPHSSLQTASMEPKLAHNQLAYNSTRNDEKLRRLAQKAELIYFFEGNCQYCYRFSPILKHFASQYGFSIVPLTLDGRSIKGFPQAKTINESTLGFKVPVVPALYLADPASNGLIPISYGLVSETYLKQQLLAIIP